MHKIIAEYLIKKSNIYIDIWNALCYSFYKKTFYRGTRYNVL